MLLNRIQRQVLTFLLFLGLATGMVVGLKSLSVERGVNLGQPETGDPCNPVWDAPASCGHYPDLSHKSTDYGRDPLGRSVPIPTWRLVTAYVDWFALEPRKGEWNFEILDKSLELAEKHQVEPLMYLGFSPPVGFTTTGRTIGFWPWESGSPRKYRGLAQLRSHRSNTLQGKDPLL